MKQSAFVAGVLLISWSTAASSARITLAELVSQSDYVVTGTIASLENEGNRAIARFAVTEVLKGAATAELFFVAPSTWSSAHLGRRFLVFLGSPPQDANVEPPTPLRFRGQPVSVIAWSGQGRFAVGELDGVTYVTLWTADLDLPADVPTVTIPALPHFIQQVPLQPLREAVQRLVGDQ